MSEKNDAHLPPSEYPTPEEILTPDFQREIAEQAAKVTTYPYKECTPEERIACATKYGPQAIDNTILSSVSENVNKMADAINRSEEQKSQVRAEYVDFFKSLLSILLVFCGGLIVADTFFGVHVRIEFLISAVVAIIADVFAIVHTLVHYMTNVEHYNAYNRIIDSLLKHIRRNSYGESSPSDQE